MANSVVPLREPGVEAQADAETERLTEMYQWADEILQQVGIIAKIKQAQSIVEMQKIKLDLKDVGIILAIHAALKPADGRRRASHFDGLHEGGLQQILKARFTQQKKDREAQLLGRAGTASGDKHTSTSWTNDLKLDADGGIRPILTNLFLFLRHHPAWKGVLAFDEFHVRVVIRKRPPWGDEPLDTPLVDHHETLIRTWFENEDIIAAQDKIGRAIQASARYNCLHPVKNYLNALTWDGTPRIDTWLAVYLGAEDTPYIRAIGPRILLAAVARISKPGCKVDTMPVLEGPQGRKKSMALRTLSEPWFTDQLSALTSKDAKLEMAGVWFIEAAELEAINRATAGTSKSFLSSPSDRFRPPYGKHVIVAPRQSILVGTINPEIVSGEPIGYLKDPTGSRRIWPFGCGVIDIDALARDRDQLWAETLVRFNAGESWWLETPELEALATIEQAARFKTDIWEKPIKEWLGNREDTSVREIVEHVLGLDPCKPNHAAEVRIQKILTGRLDFRKYRPRKDGGRENRYAREKFAEKTVTTMTAEPES
jgi:putative DNA primase/helicase